MIIHDYNIHKHLLNLQNLRENIKKHSAASFCIQDRYDNLEKEFRYMIPDCRGKKPNNNTETDDEISKLGIQPELFCNNT